MTSMLIPSALLDLISSSLPRSDTPGVVMGRSSAEVRTSFRIALSERVFLRCDLQADAGADRLRNGTFHREAKIRTAGIHPQVESGRYDDEGISIHIPEWAAEQGASSDLAEVTRRMAFGCALPQDIFPCDEDLVCSEKGYEGLTAKNAEAIGWLLGRIENGVPNIDLSGVRIQAGQDVYDGHGRLLAFPMRTRPEALRRIMTDHGEDCIRQAYLDGILYARGIERLKGPEFSEGFVDRIMDRVSGRSQDVFFHPFIAWDEASFEEHIRPFLNDAPFSGAPAEIRGEPREIAFLKACMGISPEKETSPTP